MVIKLRNLTLKQKITLLLIIFYAPSAVYLTVKGQLIPLLIVSGLVYLTFKLWLKTKTETSK